MSAGVAAHCELKDFFALPADHGVDYLIVGGYAVNYHDSAHVAPDVDLYVNPTRDNTERLLMALREFGFQALLDQEDPGQAVFLRPDGKIRLSAPPLQLDVLTSIDGVEWEAAWKNRERAQCGEVDVHYIGRRELVLNKRATGRQSDLEDLSRLGEAV